MCSGAVCMKFKDLFLACILLVLSQVCAPAVTDNAQVRGRFFCVIATSMASLLWNIAALQLAYLFHLLRATQQSNTCDTKNEMHAAVGNEKRRLWACILRELGDW